jgi:hypothetical protein
MDWHGLPGRRIGPFGEGVCWVLVTKGWHALLYRESPFPKVPGTASLRLGTSQDPVPETLMRSETLLQVRCRRYAISAGASPACLKWVGLPGGQTDASVVQDGSVILWT